VLLLNWLPHGYPRWRSWTIFLVAAIGTDAVAITAHGGIVAVAKIRTQLFAREAKLLRTHGGFLVVAISAVLRTVAYGRPGQTCIRIVVTLEIVWATCHLVAIVLVESIVAVSRSIANIVYGDALMMRGFTVTIKFGHRVARWSRLTKRCRFITVVVTVIFAVASQVLRYARTIIDACELGRTARCWLSSGATGTVVVIIIISWAVGAS